MPSLTKGSIPEYRISRTDHTERPRYLAEGMVVILSNNDAALIEVFKQGADVTGSRDNFILWLNQKSMPLGGKTPLKLLLSNKAQQVLDELVRIEHGICV